jgi:hypothetical protein
MQLIFMLDYGSISSLSMAPPDKPCLAALKQLQPLYKSLMQLPKCEIIIHTRLLIYFILAPLLLLRSLDTN